jgi:RND family efflux transporter MFP subunit
MLENGYDRGARSSPFENGGLSTRPHEFVTGFPTPFPEVFADCGLRISDCGPSGSKSAIRIPQSEMVPAWGHRRRLEANLRGAALRAISSVLLLLTVLGGCGTGAADSGDAGEAAGQVDRSAKDVLRVVVEQPVVAEGTETMVLPGSVEAWEVASLYARVTGYLEEVSVDIGDQVKTGAGLARIVMPEMVAEMRSAAAKVEQEKAELELARLTRSRLQSLREANSEAIPQQDVDVAAAKEQIEAAQVALAKAEYDRLQAMADYSRLIAPFPGRITRRLLHPGALAKEGTSSGSQPIFEIARTDRLRLAFDVPEPLVPHVRTGMAVKIRFDAFPGQELEASLTRVAGALDAKNRSMRAEIDVENPDGRYQPGMYASIQLAVAVSGRALSVPSRAVRGVGGDRYVLVVNDGVLHRKPVVVASDDGRRALIVRGLGAEDRVMVAGSPLARDGARCEAVEEQAS